MEWMLAHIFEGVCLASYESLTCEAAEAGDADMTWDAQATTPHAKTHWVLANSYGGASGPVIFTPSRGLLHTMRAKRADADHHLWHSRRLAEIVR